MSDTEVTPEPERRAVTPHRAAAAVMVLVMLAGLALLLLPYSTEIDVDLGATGLFNAPDAVQGRCEPPLLDAFHGESDDWLNYSPGDGADGLDQDGWLTGVWCSPESLQRGAIGGGIVLFGMCGLLALEVLRQRRRRQAAAAAEPDDAPADEHGPDRTIEPAPDPDPGP